MSQFTDFLYNKLPKVYREEDYALQQNLPLKRFLSVFGVGFDAIKQDIDNFFQLFDIEKCPDKYLPLLAASLGIEFPYSMTPQEQRRFIKVAPLIYKAKGTVSSFEYLGRELTGQSFTANIIENRFRVLKTNSLTNRTFGLNQGLGSATSMVSYTFGPTYNKRTFQLVLTASDESQNINATYNRLSALAKNFSPANTVMIPVILYLFSDAYNHGNIQESELVAFLTELLDDIYLVTPSDVGSEFMVEVNLTDAYTVTNDDSFDNTTIYDNLNSDSYMVVDNDSNDTLIITMDEQLDTYNIVSSEEPNSETVVELNMQESRIKRYFTETALTNMIQYRTNGNFYTNAANCVDKITNVNTGQITYQFS